MTIQWSADSAGWQNIFLKWKKYRKEQQKNNSYQNEYFFIHL
jgi:hypothetical protein